MTGAVDWELAERVAVRVSGREPFAESYHYDSLIPDFEAYTAQAEELVAAETGLRSLTGNARARVVDRQSWVRANIASFQRLLGPLVAKFEQKVTTSPLGPVAAKAAGAEVGVLLGWMSGRVLGQYDLLVVEEENPHDQDLVYYVGPNVLALEKLYAFPPAEFRLWLALHEVTHRAQFTGVPWMREHFLGLVHQAVDAVDPDPKRLVNAIGRLAESVRSGANPLEGGVMALVATDEQRVVLDQIGGLMSLLEGHGDVTMDRAGSDLIPSADRFGRVLKERRNAAQGLQRMFQQLIGLEAKIAQYEQGERFIEVVEREGGPGLLAEAWVSPDHLPTMDEIRQPNRWVDRVRPAVA